MNKTSQTTIAGGRTQKPSEFSVLRSEENARRVAKNMKRFITLSVPTEDSAFWFVYDKRSREAVECESPGAAKDLAKFANTEGWFWK